MPGILRCDRIDLNQAGVVRHLIAALAAEAKDSASWTDLSVSGRYYFTTTHRSLPPSPGWYVICDEHRRPLYAGSAENLDSRLNSPNGSRDNFANPQRTTDPVRNFIKAFCTSGIIAGLMVLFITEPSVCTRLGVNEPLSALDRGNIEKFLGVFRERVLNSAQKRPDHP